MTKGLQILYILFWLHSFTLQAQDLPVACAGDKVRYGVSGLPGSVFEWKVEGGKIERNYNDSIDVVWGNKPGTYRISVIEHTAYNCVSEVTYASVDISKPYIDIGDQYDICKGDSVIFDLDTDFKSYNWQNGVNQSTYTAYESGIVWVEVVDEKGCKAKDSVWINVHDLPHVDLGNDTIICGYSTLLLDAGYDGLSYFWSTGENTQTIMVDPGEQKYSVEVEDEYGCVNHDTINVLACLEYDEFKKGVPTAFTPNGDNKNDKFRIPGIEYYPSAEVEIFDRWGRRVFKSEMGYTDPWNGTLNGKPLPMDSYYYVIDLKNGLNPIAGSVSIIR